MPLRAPIPVPTITAVGVAKPRAHGQAIAKTLNAHRNEYWIAFSHPSGPYFSSSYTNYELFKFEKKIL